MRHQAIFQKQMLSHPERAQDETQSLQQVLTFPFCSLWTFMYDGFMFSNCALFMPCLFWTQFLLSSLLSSHIVTGGFLLPHIPSSHPQLIREFTVNSRIGHPVPLFLTSVPPTVCFLPPHTYNVSTVDIFRDYDVGLGGVVWFRLEFNAYNHRCLTFPDDLSWEPFMCFFVFQLK